jgi:hypothetical protein
VTEPENRLPGIGAGDGARAANPATDPPARPSPRCDLCGAAMVERHCRLVCPRCGYQRDCSDP